MRKFRFSRIALTVPLLVAATGALSIGAVVSTSSVASADPPFNTTNGPIDLVGVGSNTIEDLFNAYSGEEPTPASGTAPKFYTPLADPSSGDRVYSFDAENPYQPNNTTSVGCVTTKLGGGPFDRPNGSGNGRIALSDALTGTAWFEGGPPAGCDGTAATAVPVAGQIDFARSSSAPSPSSIIASPTNTNCGESVADPCLSYVPFAHDGETYAYYDGSGVAASTVNQLSDTQLDTLYTSTTGEITVGGVSIFACLPTENSGLVSVFTAAIGTTAAIANTAAGANNCSGIAQNGANSFVAAANSGNAPAANTAWVVPFSVGSWIAQANQLAQDRSATGRGDGVDLADVNSTPLSGASVNNEPYNGTAPNETADVTFDSSSIWGRNLYAVAPWFKLNAPSFEGGSTVFQGIFGTAASPGSGSICAATGAAQTDLSAFGFLKESQVTGAPACGTESAIAATPGHG